VLKTSLALLLIVVAPCLVLAATADDRVILNDGGFWRYHVQLRPPVVAGNPKQVIPVAVKYRSYPDLNRVTGPAPPAGWAAAEFDDGDWPRARLNAARNNATDSITRVMNGPGLMFCNFRLCLRGKFTVTDPKQVKALALSFRYRGGTVVYLNGRKVRTRHLSGGKVSADPPGAPYPEAAWTGGKVKKGEVHPRDARALKNEPLPLDALRKGVNVLAIEVRRSDYHPAATRPGWAPIGIAGVRLAATGPGVVPNVARPKQGFRLWNHDVNSRVCADDYGDPNEPVRPVRLVGVRNGVFSGQLVAESAKPIIGLKVVASELKGAAGAISSERVQVRYPRMDGSAYNVPRWFDGMVETPPKKVSGMQPLWISVHVPADAKPGDYTGTVTVSADGVKPVRAALSIRVVDWTLPDPVDFRTYIGIYQSPTTLAMKYKVKEWSEEHWKLMEKSFALLATVGNEIVNIPLSDQTQFGNDEGMVYWIRKPDGTYDYDFTVFDRYIQLTKKHFGVPDVVALQVWHSGGWAARKDAQKNTVTVIDGDKRERMQVPKFGTPESKAFWKPVLDAVYARLKKAGMEKSMCLGVLSDGTASGAVFKAFDEIWPGGGPAKWTRGCHSVTRAKAPYRVSKQGGVVVLHEFCYGMAMAVPEKGLPPIWNQRGKPGAAYIRHNFDHRLSLLKYRNMSERALYCGTRGIGRVCFDFWGVLPGGRRSRNLYNRYPHSSCAQRSPNLYVLSAPGPKGAISTVRFENLREGVQDSEAMIIVAEALAKHKDKLGAELAKECRQIFVDRINYCRQHAPESYGRVYIRSDHSGWQDLAARLYNAAAKVSKKLGASKLDAKKPETKGVGR
jgi:glycosyl hydrolase family 123